MQKSRAKQVKLLSAPKFKSKPLLLLLVGKLQKAELSLIDDSKLLRSALSRIEGANWNWFEFEFRPKQDSLLRDVKRRKLTPKARKLEALANKLQQFVCCCKKEISVFNKCKPKTNKQTVKIATKRSTKTKQNSSTLNKQTPKSRDFCSALVSSLIFSFNL